MVRILPKLSLRITENLIKACSIDEEEKEIYLFGVETMLMYIINFISTIIVALLLDQAWECLLFLILFMPLRSNAGGYHASTPIRCYCLSTGIVVLILIMVKHLPMYLAVELGLLLLLAASTVIVMLSPMETDNKPLDAKERKVFGFRSRFILFIEIFLCLLCYKFSWSTAFWLIVLVAVTEAFSLLAGLTMKKFLTEVNS